MQKPKAEQIGKVLSICAILAGTGAIVLTVLAVRDMHISQGVGLYFAITFGLSAEKKAICDLLVDVATTLAFLAMILVPVQIRRKQVAGNPEGKTHSQKDNTKQSVSGSCFRLLAMLLSFLPTLSLAYLVHIPDSPKSFMLRETLTQGEILKALVQFGAEFLPGTVILVAFLILARHAVCITIAAESGNAKEVKPVECNGKKHPGRIIWVLALGIGMVLFPGLSNLLIFLLQYTLILLCFGCWERLIEEKRELEPWSYILFGGFLLRGIYLLLKLMSTCRL